MPAPYDYTIGEIASPQQSFLQGIQMVDALRKREQDMAMAKANAAAAQKKQEFMQGFMGKIAAGTAKPEDYQQALLVDPANEKALTAGLGAMNTARKDTAFSNMAPVFGGLALGTPAGIQAARNALSNQLSAATNAGEKDTASAIEAQLKMLDTPEGQNVLMGQTGIGLNAIDPERFGKLNETVIKQRAAPIAERKAAAEAGEAEAKLDEATIKLKRLDALQEAELRKATSAADEQTIKAKYAERIQKAELALKNAQVAQASQATENLTEQGKLLKLDFEAATKGLPLPSKGGGTTTVGAATEDERKAAGWLAQATNAYDNMLKSMYTKEGKPTGAEKPGLVESVAVEPLKGFTRSEERQQFVQASSSLSEALLRAATGAGVNKEEAAQKIAELTPIYSDSAKTREQKLAAIPMYLRSLQERAGRAAPKNYQVPTTQNLNITVDY